MIGEPLPSLELTGLCVRTHTGGTIVNDVALRIGPGEILGLVGESGSGKTTTALAALGWVLPGATIVSGTLTVAGERRLLTARRRRRPGERQIRYVPQNPGRSLNPSLRVRRAILDVTETVPGAASTFTGVGALLDAVGLPDSDEFAARYPHQLSGGQQQRVCIAMALACDPALVVLDEPTTGLDVVTQARILDELLRLRADKQVSMLYVTHDLAVVAQIADRIAVMYAGEIVEEGPAAEVLRRPRHPYTLGLLASTPDHMRPVAIRAMPGIPPGVGVHRAGCAFADRCPQSVGRCLEVAPSLSVIGDAHAARCHEWANTPGLSRLERLAPLAQVSDMQPVVLEVCELGAVHRSGRARVVAAEGVSITLRRGGSVAIVGESGSGKTTIARAIAGLHPIAHGSIKFHGEALADTARLRTVEQRRRLQLIFQNPAEALNPRHTVRSSIGRVARLLRGLPRAELVSEVDQLLGLVRLPAHIGDRYPRELSGGELQRAAIARALAANPEVVVCDEITSALDVSVQAAIIELLGSLRAELGLSLVFITHDLGVVQLIADDVLVLDHGVVCEQGHPDALLSAPAHPYTKRLLAAAPSLSAVLGQIGEGVTADTRELLCTTNDRGVEGQA